MELILLTVVFVLTAGATAVVAVMAAGWVAEHRAAAAHAARRAAARLPVPRRLQGLSARVLAAVRVRFGLAGYFGFTITAGLALTLIAAVAAAKLADNATAGDGMAVVDHPAAVFVAAHRVTALTGVMKAVSAVGSPPVLTGGALAVSLLVCAWRRTWVPLLLVAVTGAGSAALAAVFKSALSRPRPPAAYAAATADGYGFPSGHALTAVAVLDILAFTTAISLPRPGARMAAWSAAAMAATLIGLSRVCLGVHWVTDVAGGWAFGALWLTVVVTVWAGAQQYHQARQTSRKHPHPLPPGHHDLGLPALPAPGRKAGDDGREAVRHAH